MKHAIHGNAPRQETVATNPAVKYPIRAERRNRADPDMPGQVIVDQNAAIGVADRANTAIFGHRADVDMAGGSQIGGLKRPIQRVVRDNLAGERSFDCQVADVRRNEHPGSGHRADCRVEYLLAGIHGAVN